MIHKHSQKVTDVGIDLDGVVYPFYKAFRKFCQSTMGDGNYPDPTEWDFYQDWGIGQSQFSKMIKDGATTHSLFASEKPMSGVNEAWELLKKADVRIHVVTARPSTAWAQTAEWLQRNELHADHLHFTHDKTIILHGSIGHTAMIDDHVDFYNEAKNAGMLACLHTQPWNIWLENANRVESLLEFATLITNVNNKWKDTYVYN